MKSDASFLSSERGGAGGGGSPSHAGEGSKSLQTPTRRSSAQPAFSPLHPQLSLGAFSTLASWLHPDRSRPRDVYVAGSLDFLRPLLKTHCRLLSETFPVTLSKTQLSQMHISQPPSLLFSPWPLFLSNKYFTSALLPLPLLYKLQEGRDLCVCLI